MLINCGPGRRLSKVTTGLCVSKNSLNAEDVSEHIRSASLNNSRMLSTSEKTSLSFSSVLNLARVSGFIFGCSVTIHFHSPVWLKRLTSGYKVSAALQEGEKVEWYRITGGFFTGGSCSGNCVKK